MTKLKGNIYCIKPTPKFIFRRKVLNSTLVSSLERGISVSDSFSTLFQIYLSIEILTSHIYFNIQINKMIKFHFNATSSPFPFCSLVQGVLADPAEMERNLNFCSRAVCNQRIKWYKLLRTARFSCEALMLKRFIS